MKQGIVRTKACAQAQCMGLLAGYVASEEGAGQQSGESCVPDKQVPDGRCKVCTGLAAGMDPFRMPSACSSWQRPSLVEHQCRCTTSRSGG